MTRARRRTLEQQQFDGDLWAAEVRRGLTVAQIVVRYQIADMQVRRDLRAAGHLLSALQAEVPPADLVTYRREPSERPARREPSERRPAWTRLSERDIVFLHKVRDEIRAADRAASINHPASL